MSAFNAKDFRSHLAKGGGAAQDNLFEVVIVPPLVARVATSGSMLWGQDASQVLTFRAHITDMPARNLESIDRRYAGPMRNVPVGHTYTTLQIQFIEGADRKTRDTLDKWQSSIMDSQDGWSVPYYNEVVAEYIELRLFNRNAGNSGKGNPAAKPAAVYRFYEAYPITIGASQLSWNSKNQIISVPVEMAFHRWEAIEVPKQIYGSLAINEGPEVGRSVFDDIRAGIKKFRDVVQTVNDVKTKVNAVRSQVKEAQRLADQIKRSFTNLSFKDLNTTAEGLTNIGRAFESSSTFGERVQRSPVFNSASQKFVEKIKRKF